MTRYLAVPLQLVAIAFGQTDWPSFGNDPGAMRYSPLRQIRADNVDRLKPAWTFRTGKPGSEAIPIVVDGIMYFTAPDGVYAIVPETGDLLWKYDAAPDGPSRARVLEGHWRTPFEGLRRQRSISSGAGCDDW